MIYRRPADSRSLRLLFVVVLLVLGVLLPFISAMLAPTARGVAAAALPTAYVRAPTPRPEIVALAQGPMPNLQIVPRPTTNDRRPTTNDRMAAVTATAVEPPPGTPIPAVQALATAPAAPAQPEPTLTITPVPLAPVEGGAAQPVATLFPTAPAEGRAPAAPQGGGGVPPILMYHYIRVVDQAGDPLGYELSVTPDDFDRQMAWLRDQGYAGLRMEAVTRCLRGEAPCPAKAVALTFDDGYADAYIDALPILKRYGLSATFYIVSSFVGQPGYMTWEQVAALRDAGMEIGAHTVSHLDLTSLDWGTAGYEIAQSKADIEQHIGGSVTSFCYPTGLYNPTIEEQVRAAGYLNATTTRWDSDNSDMMALPRRRVSGETGLEGFVAIVQG
jgi:peptidoglycan/xylan/chitin deacetylase (PgdA/CDA1 family)